MTGPRVIVITPRDNVATALDPLAEGQTIEANGHRVTVRESIASGHKVALATIASGAPVVKYGNPIGTATTDIDAGAHVHTHNVASERGRGDKTSAADLSAEARSAEVEGTDE